MPSHQELLDWLAVDFRETGWDVKRIFKLMVMSATYRQSASPHRKKLRSDPQNRCWHAVRASAWTRKWCATTRLPPAGCSSEKIGGPSVRPYQPPGIWEIVGMPDGDTRKYVQDHGENLYRRSVYTFWKRQAPPASMEIFNAPIPGDLHRPPRAHGYSIAGAGDIERPAVCRGGAASGCRKVWRKPTDALDFMAERLLARPLTAQEEEIVRSSAERFAGTLPKPTRTTRRNCWRWAKPGPMKM